MLRNRQWTQHTKIVCTLGPATGNRRIIERLIKAGMDVARLNLSHGTLEEHAHLIKEIRTINQSLGNPVAVLIDLPGPKYRTGKMKNGSAELIKGAKVVLTVRDIEGTEDLVPINLPTLPQDVKIGNKVLIDDGAMQLKVLRKSSTDVTCRVVTGGLLTPGRGVVIPGMHISAPFLTETLNQNLDFVIQQQPDYIALSFISKPEEVESVRDIIHNKGFYTPIISKIERKEAITNLDKILTVSDGLMVARGDLGVEIPLKNVPLLQKEIITKCNKAGKAVITATQMLESMMNSLSPTRAEVTDVANAILDGTDAIMLSGETSIGKYPVQAVDMMYDIARETERHLPFELMLNQRARWLEYETDELISFNASYTAYWLKAVAIVAFTQSGSTARRVSKYRPRVPIIAITPERHIVGQLSLNWGVNAFQIPTPASVDELFTVGTNLVKQLGIAKSGDIIIITGGIPLGRAGTTNLLKVQQVE
jgi:pyruvate kinase